MTSKRDYDAISNAIATTPMPDESRNELVDRLIVFFAQTNQHFDDERFQQACGVTS